MSDGGGSESHPRARNELTNEERAHALPGLHGRHRPFHPLSKPIALDQKAQLPEGLHGQTLPVVYQDPNPAALIETQLATHYRQALKDVVPAMQPRATRNEAVAALTAAKARGLIDAVNWFLGWYNSHILGKHVGLHQTFLPEVCTTIPAVLFETGAAGEGHQGSNPPLFLFPSYDQPLVWQGRQWTLVAQDQADPANHFVPRFATPGPCPPALVDSATRSRALSQWSAGAFSSRGLAYVLDSQRVPLPDSLRACSWTLLGREELGWVTNPDTREIPQRAHYQVVTTIAGPSEVDVTHTFKVCFDNRLAAALREAKVRLDRQYPHLVQPRPANSSTPQVFGRPY